MAKQQHNQPAQETGQQSPRFVRPEVYQTAYGYLGSIGRYLFALDAFILKLQYEQARQQQETNIGGQALAAQVAEEAARLHAAAGNVGFTVLENESRGASAQAEPYAVEMAPGAPDVSASTEVYAAADEAEAIARRAVDEALRGAATPRPDQRSVGLAS